AQGNPDEALRQFNRALAAWTTPDMASVQAAMLARKGYYRQALAHLDYYESLPKHVSRPGSGMPWLHERVLERQGYWPHEMAVLRGKLREEIAKQARPPH